MIIRFIDILQNSEISSGSSNPNYLIDRRYVVMKIVATIFWLAILYTPAVCQKSYPKSDVTLDTLFKRHIVCKLSGGDSVRVHATYIRDAAYAYSYWIPLNFKEVPSKDYSDTAKYAGPNGECSLTLWPGRTLSFPLGAVDSKGKFIGIKAADMKRVEKAVNDYILLLKKGGEKKLGNLKITEFCEGVEGFNYQIALKGFRNGFGYIYKVEVSEIPVSGDLIFKHFLLKYDLKYKAKYEKTGTAMANYFSEFRF